MNSKLKLIFGTMACASLSFSSSRAQELLPPPTPEGQTVQLQDQSADPNEQALEYLTRGPLHEAFATPYDPNPSPGEVIGQQPPDPIEEIPPEYRPEGNNVAWMPGYWVWDEVQTDFIWISGVWREIPPNMRWVPGYWEQNQNGFRRVSGFWTNAAEQEIVYLPPPPESLEAGPSSPQPRDDFFYIPGHWVYQANGYAWSPGIWSPVQDQWMWTPTCYTWTPRGYIYRPGYWDYEPSYRGVVFTPVYFRQPLYRQAAFRYQPRYVVNTNLALLVHLFIRPQSRQYYYFGNYYGNNYAQQYLPWVRFQSQSNMYDPFYSYYHGNNRQNLLTWVNTQHSFYETNSEYRPAANVRNQALQIESLAAANIDDSTRQLSQVAVNVRDLVRSGEAPLQLRAVTAPERNRITEAIRPIVNLAKQRSLFEREVELSGETAVGSNVAASEQGAQAGAEARRGDLGRANAASKSIFRLPKAQTPSFDPSASGAQGIASERERGSGVSRSNRDLKGNPDRGSGDTGRDRLDRGDSITVQRPELPADAGDSRTDRPRDGGARESLNRNGINGNPADPRGARDGRPSRVPSGLGQPPGERNPGSPIPAPDLNPGKGKPNGNIELDRGGSNGLPTPRSGANPQSINPPRANPGRGPGAGVPGIGEPRGRVTPSIPATTPGLGDLPSGLRGGGQSANPGLSAPRAAPAVPAPRSPGLGSPGRPTSPAAAPAAPAVPAPRSPGLGSPSPAGAPGNSGKPGNAAPEKGNRGRGDR
jgi:hypothetical protein